MWHHQRSLMLAMVSSPSSPVPKENTSSITSEKFSQNGMWSSDTPRATSVFIASLSPLLLLLILPSPAVLAPRQMLPEVVSRPTRGLSATSLVRRRGWWPLAQYLPTERSLLRTAPATGKESVQPSPLPMFRSGNGTSPTRLSLRLLLAVFLYLMNGLLSLHQRHHHLKLPPPQHLQRRLLRYIVNLPTLQLLACVFCGKEFLTSLKDTMNSSFASLNLPVLLLVFLLLLSLLLLLMQRRLFLCLVPRICLKKSVHLIVRFMLDLRCCVRSVFLVFLSVPAILFLVVASLRCAVPTASRCCAAGTFTALVC